MAKKGEKLSKELRLKLSTAQKRSWKNGSYKNRNVENLRKNCIRMGEINRGKRAWNNRQVDLICPNCGKRHKRSPSHSDKICCSKNCSLEYYVGKRHHAYIDGQKSMGNSWKYFSNKVKSRDKICKICGSSGDHLGRLYTHHVVPRRLFSEINDSNNFENLILLCDSCHKRLDSWFAHSCKEGEFSGSLSIDFKIYLCMVILSQALQEIVRWVQRLPDEAKFLWNMLVIPTRAPSPKGKI